MASGNRVEITAEYIQKAWKEIMVGEPTEAATDATFSKYAVSSLIWEVDGNELSYEELVRYCGGMRARTQDVTIDVTHVVNSEVDGKRQSANRHVCYFQRKDGSTVKNECFQILDVNDKGLFTRGIAMARPFDDSRKQESA